METGRTLSTDQRYITGGRTRRHTSGSPLGAFIEGIADQRGITIQGLSQELGEEKKFLNRIRMQKRPTSDTISRVLEVFGKAGILDKDQQTALTEATAATVEGVIQQYGSLVEMSPVRVKTIQGQQVSGCKTFTGAQAAREIGISNVAANRWRNKLGLPYLLNYDQVRMIAANVKKKEVNF